MNTCDDGEIDVALTDVGIEFPTSDGFHQVIAGFSHRFRRGKLACIVGPSGCGKTTLLRMILREIQPTRGTVTVDATRGGGGMAYVPQSALLLPWRTLLQNASLGMELRGALNSARIERLTDLIRDYGLAGFESHPVRALSGGMQQRTAVIRALASAPSILLCDEPFSSVDFVTRLSLSTLFKKMCHIGGITTILVTHNIEEAIFLGDEVLVLAGRPARLVRRHEPRLSVHAEDAVRCRDAPEFNGLFHSIWHELGETDAPA